MEPINSIRVWLVEHNLPHDQGSVALVDNFLRSKRAISTTSSLRNRDLKDALLNNTSFAIMEAAHNRQALEQEPFKSFLDILNSNSAVPITDSNEKFRVFKFFLLCESAQDLGIWPYDPYRILDQYIEEVGELFQPPVILPPNDTTTSEVSRAAG